MVEYRAGQPQPRKLRRTRASEPVACGLIIEMLSTKVVDLWCHLVWGVGSTNVPEVNTSGNLLKMMVILMTSIMVMIMMMLMLATT